MAVSYVLSKGFMHVYNFRGGRGGGYSERDGVDNGSGPSYKSGGGGSRDPPRSSGRWEDRSDGNTRDWNDRSDSRRG